MSDIIHLLPDNVANQIAAGEVIQRPASVVKELLENSVDAGSSKISLTIKDAGKTLIQVMDSGKGMSETDARMCFERHATSKIREADQLFRLNTKGFRGEALASIASIAHVNLKTKRKEDELGTEINIEGSIVKSQEPVQAVEGTVFSVKNLFFNVPARRNFLKSDQVETRHIVDEFIRIAMAHPDIEFSLHHNGDETYYLPPAPLKQRLIGIFGKHYNERLVPIKEDTTIVELSGFLVKPEHAKKSRGDQYFFVNDRYIKSNYLNHAVNWAYEELIQKNQYPGYFIFLRVDPKTIDVNIHPTKTEVKFEDERHIYMIIQSAVRSSLGKFNITPTIDFDQEQSFNQFIPPDTEIKTPEVKVNRDYNPFKTDTQERALNGNTRTSDFKRASVDGWQALYPKEQPTQIQTETEKINQEPSDHKFLQLNQKYLIGSIKSGYIIIDQYRAHYRILYDKFKRQLDHQNGSSQGLIFPDIVTLTKDEFKYVNSIEHELSVLGFKFEKENYQLKISAKPSDLSDCDAQEMIETMLERFKMNIGNDQWSPKENILRSLAKSGAVKKGRKLNTEEMNRLVDELFACSEPQYAPNGKRVIKTIDFEELEKQFS